MSAVRRAFQILLSLLAMEEAPARDEAAYWIDWGRS